MVSPQPTSTVASEKFNVLAIVGFILSFFVSIVGAILGVIALVQIRRTGQRGHGLALAAVIIGVVLFILGIVIDIAVLPQLMSGVTSR